LGPLGPHMTRRLRHAHFRNKAWPAIAPNSKEGKGRMCSKTGSFSGPGPGEPTKQLEAMILVSGANHLAPLFDQGPNVDSRDGTEWCIRQGKD